jgi:hypothetical protein
MDIILVISILVGIKATINIYPVILKWLNSKTLVRGS